MKPTISALASIACLIFFCLLLQSASYSDNFEPERSKGISVHLTPESVVQIANDKNIQRFIVTFEDEKGAYQAVDNKAVSLIENIKTLPENFQQNGIWVVLTHPDSYSVQDQTELAELERLAAINKIPLFESRASELPDSWKRK